MMIPSKAEEPVAEVGKPTNFKSPFTCCPSQYYILSGRLYYRAALSVPPRKITAAETRELSYVEIFQCDSWSKKTFKILLSFEDI